LIETVGFLFCPKSLDLSRVPAFAHYNDSRYGVLSAAAFCCYVNQLILPSGRNRSHRGVSFSYGGIVLIWDFLGLALA